MLASASTEIHRGRGRLTPLASEPGKDGGKRRVAMLAHQQADRDDGLTHDSTSVRAGILASPKGDAMRGRPAGASPDDRART
jgi:hypothetical protein